VLYTGGLQVAEYLSPPEGATLYGVCRQTYDLHVHHLRRIWEELRKGASPDLIATEQDELLAGMEAAFRALKRLQKAADAFQVSV
jgi:hypothetical protein